MNSLYYGDNLEILGRYVKDESVDLVYLDPPFNSAQDYNVLFAERNGSQSAAQIKAFGDTWQWTQESERAWQEVVEKGGKVAEALMAFRQFLGATDMLAYLSMMAPRLVELRRVLKETGSIYLHCDPTASQDLRSATPLRTATRRTAACRLDYRGVRAYTSESALARRCGPKPQGCRFRDHGRSAE